MLFYYVIRKEILSKMSFSVYFKMKSIPVTAKLNFQHHHSSLT